MLRREGLYVSVVQFEYHSYVTCGGVLWCCGVAMFYAMVLCWWYVGSCSMGVGIVGMCR